MVDVLVNKICCNYDHFDLTYHYKGENHQQLEIAMISDPRKKS
jgi:hypothetical protein